MTKQYFHFTIGPVQGFVAQARRTRDFWAGSFILSWLSAKAMLSVKKQGGIILFPLPDANYLAWVEGTGTGAKPRQGSIPNRFKAEIQNPDFKPEILVKTVQDAWWQLGEHIWENDLKDVCSEAQKKDIWDKQVKGFWEIAWALTENEAESDILDRRKNWRNYMPPPQKGVKCMVMEGWQELSGAERPGQEVENFWKKVRSKKVNGFSTDFREGECLSAIAFIKRRFARHFESFSATTDGIQIKGWDLSNGVPSVSYMAACKWLAQIIEKGAIQDLKEFHDQAVKLTGETDWGGHSEIQNDIKCVKEAIKTSNQDKRILNKFATLDGSVFFEAALENKNLFEDQEQTKKVKCILKKIIKSTELKNPTPFYAILLMDGDSLGVHMSKIKNQKPISEALKEFTNKVPAIVYDNHGFLIYAGGDDVLAMFPIETALGCAQKLRGAYLEAFVGKPVGSTLSGAIEYAHIKMPLTKVLKDAHQLLDHLAKDGRGRDAIACRVWKPGGKAVEWAMPWEIALDNDKIIIEEMKEHFLKDGEEASFSSKFFFKLQKHFDLIPFDDEQMRSLLAMDYLASGVNETTQEVDKLTMQKAKEIIDPLLKQCTPVVRNSAETYKSKWTRLRLERSSDAALLVRFLANKGVER